VSDVIAELLPVFILIVIGWGVRAGGVISAEGFGWVNRFGYFVLYPAFLFNLSSNADLRAGEAGKFILGLMLGFAIMFAIALALKPIFFRDEGPAFTSVLQGSVRWNGFVLLAAAPALYGHAGLHLIGIAFGPLVLAVNFCCVLALARWGENGANSARAIFDQIVANPLILGCGVGLLAQLFHVHATGPVATVINLLGAAAMPIAIVCVGSGLDFRAVRDARAKVAAASFCKLIIAPAVMYGAATLVGAPPIAAAVAAGVGSTPTAAAGYTLAREMGGDAHLMAAIITATTLLSFLTMPIAIALTLH
jgi:predicted permease